MVFAWMVQELVAGVSGPPSIAPDGRWQVTALVPGGTAVWVDGREVARLTRDQVVWGGVTAPVTGDPSSLVVSADGAHAAWATADSLRDRSEVVVGGRTVSTAFAPRSLTLSPDGARWAVTHQVDRYSGGEYAVVDGVKHARHSAVWGFTFTPDGAHVAYVAVDGERSTLVVDGRAVTSASSLSQTPTFTADGRVVVTGADGAGFVRVGDAVYPAGSLPQLGVAGRAVAWVDEVEEGGRTFARAVWDGEVVFRRDVGPGGAGRLDDRGPSVGSVALTPAGDRLAFGALSRAWVVEKGGEPRELCGGDPVSFEASGRRLVVETRGADGWRLDVADVASGAVTPTPPWREAPGIHRATVRLDGSELSFLETTGQVLRRASTQLPQ